MVPIPRFSQEYIRTYVVLGPKKDQSFTDGDILDTLKSFGYKFSILKLEVFNHSIIVLQLENKEATKKLFNDPRLRELEISVDYLVGLNGIRLSDANVILKSLSVDPEIKESDLMRILIELICLESPEKEEVAVEELKIIRDEISRIIENSVCTTFGSYPSQVRRNGFSDIDLAVSSMPTKSTDIRPLQIIIDNPKCLLEKQLTYAEFYSYPNAEVIKIIYNFFMSNKDFCERFHMRAHLVETPIVMLKSTKISELDMSYDISVNNQISIEKAQILNDFIVADKSDGNKMRSVAMFLVHWAKSNKLLGGAYPDEKLVIKFKFNSYVINYLIIHFVQVAAKMCIVNTLEKAQNRVATYNFDEIFDNYADFLSQFFDYYLAFDYEKKGIFGTMLFEKKELAESKRVKISPFMIVDSLDTTHNLSGLVTPDGLKFFQNLMAGSLEKMKSSNFRITDLLG